MVQDSCTFELCRRRPLPLPPLSQRVGRGGRGERAVGSATLLLNRTVLVLEGDSHCRRPVCPSLAGLRARPTVLETASGCRAGRNVHNRNHPSGHKLTRHPPGCEPGLQLWKPYQDVGQARSLPKHPPGYRPTSRAASPAYNRIRRTQDSSAQCSTTPPTE